MGRRRVGSSKDFDLRRAWLHRWRAIAAAAAVICLTVTTTPARADFGGISFWLPGLMGSLTAVPGQPGWSWMTMYIHLSQEASGGKTFLLGGAFVAGVKARADVVASGPSYT